MDRGCTVCCMWTGACSMMHNLGFPASDGIWDYLYYHLFIALALIQWYFTETIWLSYSTHHTPAHPGTNQPFPVSIYNHCPSASCQASQVWLPFAENHYFDINRLPLGPSKAPPPRAASSPSASLSAWPCVTFVAFQRVGGSKIRCDVLDVVY